MKKIYWGFTKEQIWILSILTCGIFIGMFLKYFPSWDNKKVYENFKKDSILLAQKMEKYYSDTLYHSEETIEKYVDSVAEHYKLSNKKKIRSSSKIKNEVKFPVNINEANVEELIAIKGIGVKTAEKIILFRDKNGPFKQIEDLKKIKGIGQKKFNKISSFITVEK